MKIFSYTLSKWKQTLFQCKKTTCQIKISAYMNVSMTGHRSLGEYLDNFLMACHRRWFILVSIRVKGPDKTVIYDVRWWHTEEWLLHHWSPTPQPMPIYRGKLHIDPDQKYCIDIGGSCQFVEFMQGIERNDR